MWILFGDLSFDRQLNHPLRDAYGPKRFHMWYLQAAILHKGMFEVSMSKILNESPSTRWWRSSNFAEITWDITVTNPNCIVICVHTVERVSPIEMFYPNTFTFTPVSARTSAKFAIAVSSVSDSNSNWHLLSTFSFVPEFNTKHNLRVHKRRHNPDMVKRFICKTCGKGFMKNDKLSIHIRWAARCRGGTWVIFNYESIVPGRTPANAHTVVTFAISPSAKTQHWKLTFAITPARSDIVAISAANVSSKITNW